MLQSNETSQGPPIPPFLRRTLAPRQSSNATSLMIWTAWYGASAGPKLSPGEAAAVRLEPRSGGSFTRGGTDSAPFPGGGTPGPAPFPGGEQNRTRSTPWERTAGSWFEANRGQPPRRMPKTGRRTNRLPPQLLELIDRVPLSRGSPGNSSGPTTTSTTGRRRRRRRYC